MKYVSFNQIIDLTGFLRIEGCSLKYICVMHADGSPAG